ncbi:mucin-5AC-like isoform X2 [Zophobas morio]|uniref:mucin-5AC-like isoform X2 n=1 Tax=Zophobas morio TaxID=2755281 RepID=UPI0030835B6E
MSLIDLKFEKAAKILAESEDEVLQAAGLMALMRLETKDLFSAKDMVETLHRRLKQFDKEPKPLMPMRILVQNKDTTPSLNTSTAWCRTALPVATAQSVNSASLDLFSSPKSSCDSKTLATTVENSNILSSNLFSSPKSTFVFNTTPTTVQTANTIFSSVFTGPISSSGCNTTATTIQSVNVLGSSVFTRPSFDLNMTSTTTHSTNAISSILLPSAKTRGDLTNMEPVATTSPMLINRS